MTGVSVLHREMYAEAEAARLLRVSQGTLHYWLEGGTQRGKAHKPIIRQEPTGSRTVKWAEFVEAGLLRGYRRRQVPMAELRAFIDELRNRYGVPYPLAHHQPFIIDRQLVLEAQEAAHLDARFCLVAFASKQLILTPASQDFIERVRWEDDIAVAWRPHDDPQSPVRMTPDVRFGRPAVGGISTDVIWEHSQAGGDDEEIASEFGIPVDMVHWALAYETSARATTA